MSVEMTAPEMNAEGTQQPPEEPPKQKVSRKAAKRTWICSTENCGAVIHWLPDGVDKLPPELIRCKKCQKAFEAAEAAKTAEAPADAPAPPAPVREAPKRAPKHAGPPKHAPQQRRPAGAMHRAQAPRGLTFEAVELCAFRAGIAPPQVNALLTALRSHIQTPSSNE